MRKYDAVFLDAQGTLLKAYPSVPSIYARACQRVGREASPREVVDAIRDLWTEVRRSRQGREVSYDTSDEATRAWWTDFNTRLYRRLGMHTGLEQFLDALWEDFGRPESWRLYPEVKDVLAELSRRNYRMGVVSNWDSRLIPICEGLGVTRYLDFVLASALMGMEKPDRRIFEIALSRARVPAERAIHVGDDYDADVLGAQGAGIDALLIDREGRTPAGISTIRTLDELLHILR